MALKNHSHERDIITTSDYTNICWLCTRVFAYGVVAICRECIQAHSHAHTQRHNDAAFKVDCVHTSYSKLYSNYSLHRWPVQGKVALAGIVLKQLWTQMKIVGRKILCSLCQTCEHFLVSSNTYFNILFVCFDGAALSTVAVG